MIRYLLVFICLVFFTQVHSQEREIVLYNGLVIHQSGLVQKKEWRLQGNPEDVFSKGGLSCTPAITIEGQDIVVDFQQSKIIGTSNAERPDLFYGACLLIRGKNITIKNLKISGFKVAILADNSVGLKIHDCDVSYNYRPRLFSGRENEAFSDWLSYHQNENNEWLRYGAGIYLHRCDAAEVKNCKGTNNQNALLLANCNDGTFWNNTFQFNSGLGIGMYRSSRNRIMHNKLDWNVRGYSHGFYQRGQDSAGILVFEQCNDNLFAYNSATHSGDGFFLWAGQSTMDSGIGGCNNNLIFGNDFSHAPTNGIEVTFSTNEIRGNLISECTYGIWGGYSYETLITGNLIDGCKTGLAIEHGQNNTIRQNLFLGDSTGIYGWANTAQPGEWGYTQHRDTRSRNIVIDKNVFLQVRKPLKISASDSVAVNGENLFAGFQELFDAPKPNTHFSFIRNDIYGDPDLLQKVWDNPALTNLKNLNFSHEKLPEDPYEPLQVSVAELHEPDSLEGWASSALAAGFPRGRQFILMDEWGPYDFRRPIAALDTISGNLMTMTLLGPSGDWQVKNMMGVKSISNSKGIVPAVLIVERDPLADFVQVTFEYTSPEGISSVFGRKIPPGERYNFDFKYFAPKINWTTSFYAVDSVLVNKAASEGFSVITTTHSLQEIKTNKLWFAWWAAPATNVPADYFATQSVGQIKVPPGHYAIHLTSDDGARLYVDGKKVIDHWDIHEPLTDSVEMELSGKHTIVVEHFDATGFSTLDCRLEKLF